MSKTFWDLKSKVWDLLGQRSTSINFSSAKVGEALNQRILDFLRGKIKSVLQENKTYSCGKLWIAEGSSYIRTIANTSLSQAYTPGNTTLYCSCVNLLSSGYVQIWGQIFQYTSKDAWNTHLQWVTSVDSVNATLASWDTVVQLYTMAANFEKPKEVTLVDEVSGTKIVELALNKKGTYTAYYEIRKTASGVSLMNFIGVDSNSLLKIQYSSIYTPLVNDTDICPIPDHYGESCIAFLVAWEMWLDKGIPKAQNILARAYANIETAYWFFNSESSKPKTFIRPQVYSFNAIRKWKII
jgi:hypothetical protein